MSDAIEGLKAVARRKRDLREASWLRRHEEFRRIEAEGFLVELMSHESRHYRIRLKGGWFDVWPSTWRWAQSPRKGGKRGLRGQGVDSLIVALKEAAA